MVLLWIREREGGKEGRGRVKFINTILITHIYIYFQPGNWKRKIYGDLNHSNNMQIKIIFVCCNFLKNARGTKEIQDYIKDIFLSTFLFLYFT